jgi:anti-sigma B factor antagonist
VGRGAIVEGERVRRASASRPRPLLRTGNADTTGSGRRDTVPGVTGRNSHGSFDDPGPTDRLMTLTTIPIGSAAVVEVVGELDLHTAPDLMAAVDDALAHRPGLTTVIIDLSRVDFLGSSGLGVLANLATRATAPDRPAVALRVVAPADHRPVIRPWEAMNLQQILPLYPDVAAALDARG